MSENRRREYQTKINPDGSLRNKRYELYALHLADHIHPAPAWRMASGDKTPDKGEHTRNFWAYRKIVENNLPFRERLAHLIAKHDEIMTDPVYGEAKWAAVQCYLIARAEQDAKGMQEAAALLFKIAEKQTAFREAMALKQEAEKPPEKAPVGRPVRENPQNKRSLTDLKAKLVNMNGKTAENG